VSPSVSYGYVGLGFFIYTSAPETSQRWMPDICSTTICYHSTHHHVSSHIDNLVVMEAPTKHHVLA
jgi:hypothetical protein